MRTYRILFMAAATLAMVACSKNGGNEVPNGREELKLSGDIHTAEVQYANLSRATFATGKKFALFVEDNSGNNYFSLKTTTGTTGAVASDKNAVSLDPKLYWDDLGGRNAELTMYGVYPSTITGLISNTSEIAWTITDNVDDSDLMRASVDYEYADRGTAAHLQFEHVLSKITIVVKPGNDTGYTQSELAGAKVTYHIPTTVTYDFMDNTSVAGTDGTFVLSPGTVDASGNNTYTILSYPLQKTGSYKLATISIAKSGRTDTYDVILDAGVTMAAGEHYVFNVSVHKSDITVAASIADWDTQAEEDIDTKFIEVDKISIANGVDTELTDGTLLYLYVVDNAGKKGNTVYKYTGNSTTGTWALLAGETPLYWDDYNRTFTAKALLMLGGNNDGEHIMTATKDITAIGSKIDLGTFTRPFSKITVEVTTSTGTDKVDLDGLKCVEFKDSYNYQIGTDKVTVSENTSGGLVKVNYNNTTTVDAYIFPYSVSANGVLCKIAIQETVDVLNTYNLVLDNAITFAAGKHYTYSVNITKSEITTTASVVDWVSGGSKNIDSKLD